MKTKTILIALILGLVAFWGCDDDSPTGNNNVAEPIVGSWEEYQNFDSYDNVYQDVDPDESFWYFTSDKKFLILHRNNGSYSLETLGILSYEIVDDSHILISSSMSWKYVFLDTGQNELMIEDLENHNKYWFNKVTDAPDHNDYLP